MPPVDKETRLSRFDDRLRSGTHLWTTLGYRRVSWGEGSSAVAWDATLEAVADRELDPMTAAERLLDGA